jgi:hypothetical protein
MLTRIEKAFWSIKSSLGLRPNFHQKEHRAHTHKFISMIAYQFLHSIEYMLRQHGDHRTWTTVRDVLDTHKRLTIEFDVKEHDDLKRNHLRSCRNPEPEHMEISKRLRLHDIIIIRKWYDAKRVMIMIVVRPAP